MFSFAFKGKHFCFMRNWFVKITESISCNRNIICGIKYIPVICALLLTLHVGLLLIGIQEAVTVGVAAVLLVLLLVLLSIKFHFCILHKMLILYMAVCTLCICIQRMNGFEHQILKPVRLVLFALGIALLTWAAIKLKDDDCGK